LIDKEHASETWRYWSETKDHIPNDDISAHIPANSILSVASTRPAPKTSNQHLQSKTVSNSRSDTPPPNMDSKDETGPDRAAQEDTFIFVSPDDDILATPLPTTDAEETKSQTTTNSPAPVLAGERKDAEFQAVTVKKQVTRTRLDLGKHLFWVIFL
jgi:hypothetical protein